MIGDDTKDDFEYVQDSELARSVNPKKMNTFTLLANAVNQVSNKVFVDRSFHTKF